MKVHLRIIKPLRLLGHWTAVNVKVAVPSMTNLRKGTTFQCQLGIDREAQASAGTHESCLVTSPDRSLKRLVPYP